jgi:dimethylamine monooxygenase subunit A
LDTDNSTRPYLQGPPRFDVGLRPIALENWLLPDDQANWLPEKNRLIDTDRSSVFCEHDGSQSAQQELQALVVPFCERAFTGQDPALLQVSRMFSDDFVIMEHEAGEWRTTACCLCSPTFFSAQHAIGKTLMELHTPVPDGDVGLSQRIGRVFSNLQPDTILERHNWTVQWSDARNTPDGGLLREQAAAANITQAREHLFLRVERQTIRKLPRTGALVFTIRIRLSNLAALLNQPEDATAFAAAWQSASNPVRTYKKWAVLERHVAALLSQL